MAISGLPDDPIYSGTSLSLTCTVVLHDAIDTGVAVSSTWRRSGELLTTSARRNISDIMAINSSVYQTYISTTPLSSTLDSGHYTCRVTVIPEPSLPFVHMVTSATTITVNVEGKL